MLNTEKSRKSYENNLHGDFCNQVQNSLKTKILTLEIEGKKACKNYVDFINKKNYILGN